ncbi:MAG: amidohydrolase family protein, partial [Thermodesulfobacteriota bacterium]
EGVLTINELIKKLTVNPVKIIGIERGTLKVGSVADLVIFDPDKSVTVDREKFRSKGKNTPFHGWQLSGTVRYTIVGGKVVYSG